MLLATKKVHNEQLIHGLYDLLTLSIYLIYFLEVFQVRQPKINIEQHNIVNIALHGFYVFQHPRSDANALT